MPKALYDVEWMKKELRRMLTPESWYEEMENIEAKRDDVMLVFTYHTGTREDPTSWCVEIWVWDDHLHDYVDGQVYKNYAGVSFKPVFGVFMRAVRELVYGTIERPA